MNRKRETTLQDRMGYEGYLPTPSKDNLTELKEKVENDLDVIVAWLRSGSCFFSRTSKTKARELALQSR